MGLEQTPKEAWLSFKDISLTAAYKRAPIIKQCVGGRYVPWLTPEIKDLIYTSVIMNIRNRYQQILSYAGVITTSRYAVNTKMRKEKCNYYCNKLSGDQTSKVIWKTLNSIFPKEKKCVTNSRPSNLSATKFNELFYIDCKGFMQCLDSAFPRILVSRVKKDFALHAVDASFIRNEMAKLKLSKSTGLDKIPAELFKDAASVIAKPYLINVTISTGEIPSHWKEARVTSTVQVEYK